MHRTSLALALAASILTSAPTLFDPLWNLLSSLGSPAATDEGCGWDPWGRCLPASQSASDNGCGADPWGRCPAPQPAADAGCGWDPWGCPK